MAHLLDACLWVRIVVYDCGVEPLPEAIVKHARVEVRDKSGALATAPFFYGAFDFCAQCGGEAPPFCLFLHGHDSAWHQKLPVGVLLALCAKAIAQDPALEFANLSDQLLPDWVTPGVLEWVADGVRSPSMLVRVANAWPAIGALLGGADADSAPPRTIYEVHGAQALVAGSRIRARTSASWKRLREYAAGLTIHSDADYALEASFHRIFGEPWDRPFVRGHEAALLRGTSNELEIRCGCRYSASPAASTRRPSLPGTVPRVP